jgi:hypothetical protein
MAVTGPLSGGQNETQDPLHMDLVLVSGPNQYSAKPFEFVSTTAPPIFAVETVFPEAAADEFAPEPPELPELPHPTAISAAAASPAGASHTLFIPVLHSSAGCADNLENVPGASIVQAAAARFTKPSRAPDQGMTRCG